MANLGLLGAGAFGEFSLEAYRRIPNLKIKKIYDPDLERATKVARRYQIDEVSKSVDDLLADRSIVAVIVLTPPNTHESLGRQIIESNKSALIEKPIAFTAEAARAIIDQAETRKLHLTANLVLRQHPFHLKIKEISRKKIFGSLRSISSTALLASYPTDHWYWDRALSGGFFINSYCHFIDLYGFIAGHELTKGNNRATSVGHDILLSYGEISASLTTNLHVSNNQEFVQTVFSFDSAVITTTGWFPKTMTIAPKNQARKNHALSNKEANYQKALSSILEELLSRIDGKTQDLVIEHDDLYRAVLDPILVEKNSLN